MKKKRRGRKSGPAANLRWIKLTVLGLALLMLLTALCMIAADKLKSIELKLTYRREIMIYAREYELDPYLVAAVIHCESSNRSEVVSHAGAVGLMQIMPDTGAWIAEKIGIEGYEESMLTRPDVNIEMGCWYLNYLGEKFGGDLRLTLAAFNAGPGNVEKWLKDSRFSRDGELVEIPFEETARYVEKVQRTHELYKRLHKGEMG